MGDGTPPLTVRRSLAVALLTSARTWRGSGVSLASIALGLSDAGHRVYLLAGEADVVAGFGKVGLSAIQVRTADTGLAEVWLMARVLREIGSDTIVVDRPRDLRLATLASLIHPVAIIHRYNLSRSDPPRDLLTRLAYRRVRLTVFPSRSLAERTLAHAAYLRHAPHRVIHGSVDVEQFYPDRAAADEFRRRHALGADQFVLAVGSLTLEKRYDFLLEAVAALAPDPPLLVVCGEGSHGPRLRERAQDLGLRTRFLGQLAPDWLRGAYTASTCFAHAGAVETFGLSVLEAMACGCAVVGVRGGAVPEVVDEAGFLAQPESATDFAALLRLVLADDATRARLGQAAIRRATEEFSVSAMRGAYAAAVESVWAEPAMRARCPA